MSMTKFTLSELKLAEQAWPTTLQYVMQTPHLKAQVDQSQQAVMEKLEKLVNVDTTKPLISKEECLEKIKFMEERKLVVLKKL